MSDLIDRQAAIDAIEEMQMPIMRSEFPEEQFVFTGMSEALNAIKRLPSVQPEPKWIPCSERLPFSEYGESDSVLATCEHRNPDYDDDFRWIKRLYYNGGVWCYPTGEMYEEHVVAWMPLPSPYREGGD